MFEITDLSFSEIDAVGGGALVCRRENVLICNGDGSSCVWQVMMVCQPGTP